MGCSMSNNIKPIEKALIKQLFARFGGVFSHKWTSSLKSKYVYQLAVHDWAKGLAGCTVEQINNGIDQARDELEWPPSVREFRLICLGVDAEAIRQRVIEYVGQYDWKMMSLRDQHKAVDRYQQTASREIADQCIQQNMALLAHQSGGDLLQ